jgi:hypothetical protein
VAAREGLDAGRKVQTMVWLGHLQTRGAVDTLSFVLQMKRPDKMRFEVVQDEEKSIRAFDGAMGWRMKPPRTGKAELITFTPDEVQYAHDAPGMDGPLIVGQANRSTPTPVTPSPSAVSPPADQNSAAPAH